MRSRLLLAGSIGLLIASPATAGTLTSATWTQVVSSPGLGPDPLLTFQRDTDELGASGSSTTTSINVALSFPPLLTSFFVPKTPNGILDVHVLFSQGGAQAISASPGMGSATPGIPGTLIVMSALHDAMGVNQSMFNVGTNTIVQVPLSVGKAGQFTNTFIILGNAAAFTIDFYAWTPGTIVFTGLTTKLVPLPDVIAMGSFDLTANGGGTVTLVSPSKITAECALLTTQSILSIATLKLSFVPEPGTLLLLASGAVALLGLRARRAG